MWSSSGRDKEGPLGRGSRGPASPGKRAACCAVLGAFLLASCAGGPPPQGDAGERPRKSPVIGELLAIFPGFFVHGMGHRYAENTEKADEILAMELYSLFPIALGGLLWGIGENQDADAVKIAGWIGMGVGAVPFLGTWIYDLVYTPSEVERYNLHLGRSE